MNLPTEHAETAKNALTAFLSLLGVLCD